MGMQEVAIPEAWGLPEYKITKMQSEIEGLGHDVRLICGANRFGQTNWLYTVICSPEDLLRLARECERVALEALNLQELMRERKACAAH